MQSSSKVFGWLQAHVLEIALLCVFLVMNGAYLNRIPGLLGDEASEGENVFVLETLVADIVEGEKVSYGGFVRGERSYIGPIPDYVRIPFILLFGYSLIALRLPFLLLSLASFFIALKLLRSWFGQFAGTIATVMMLFSPAYIAYQRLGWAITALPFFALLLLLVLRSSLANRALLVGMVAGLGLHVHILFLPTMAAIVVASLIYWKMALLRTIINDTRQVWLVLRGAVRDLRRWWPAVIGFLATFSTQLAVLLLFRSDQGSGRDAWAQWWVHVRELPAVFQDLISGSAYFARYTGDALPDQYNFIVLFCMGVLILGSLAASRKRAVLSLWLLGLVTHVVFLLYMIESFSLRYMVIATLGVYILAGASLGYLIERMWTPSRRIGATIAISLAVVMSIYSIYFGALPFFATGGSLSQFHVGPKIDAASGLVATDDLVQCVRGAGLLYGENIHIFNRLQFLSHEFDDIEVLPEDGPKNAARWLVNYRIPTSVNNRNHERCPDLKHWKVVLRDQTHAASE